MIKEVDFDPCQLTEFAQRIGKHHQTINGWFNSLESSRIHYVNRVTRGKERVYDYQDYLIGLHILNKRNSGWALPAIYEALSEEANLQIRPFPQDFNVSIDNTNQMLEEIRYRFTEDNKKQLNEMSMILIEENRRTLGELTSLISRDVAASMERMLPAPKDPQQERAEYVVREQTKSRIRKTLRAEAIEAWNKLPVSERCKPTGWFGKKEDDPIKRADFIQNYIDDHEAERWAKEFDLS